LDPIEYGWWPHWPPPPEVRRRRRRRSRGGEEEEEEGLFKAKSDKWEEEGWVY